MCTVFWGGEIEKDTEGFEGVEHCNNELSASAVWSRTSLFDSSLFLFTVTDVVSIAFNEFSSTFKDSICSRLSSYYGSDFVKKINSLNSLRFSLTRKTGTQKKLSIFFKTSIL